MVVEHGRIDVLQHDPRLPLRSLGGDNLLKIRGSIEAVGLQSRLAVRLVPTTGSILFVVALLGAWAPFHLFWQTDLSWAEHATSFARSCGVSCALWLLCSVQCFVGLDPSLRKIERACREAGQSGPGSPERPDRADAR